ncbi:hypothetical protein HanHA300_Chr15g0572601 [Helianthus annuus]|nr:hypothetical protein HanHA300_Chr15g0572601 [Helianthus annuus]KAJ0473761.1 hypothetical protein HanHA89_Chr15g0622081 [Helianthus annuus]KAJ0629244.1 hypothetical protein HanIR_Chr00c19g0909871 [Helianthus annuus]KAJ0649337.1 hypothetical protein HanLR1_Chr15g0583171 [Helianthus annuus]KAJ0653138.1 hypothetical protein HanOQP8_Chr15g0580191 [Helianthus annuus]
MVTQHRILYLLKCIYLVIICYHICMFIHSCLFSSLICSSNNSSWIRTIELLGQVASHGESTGYEVPCIIIAAKGDLEPNPTALQDSTRLSQDMGIEAPVPISTRLGDFTDVYKKIVRAAEHPHLSIHR